jgi:hypothetical protein
MISGSAFSCGDLTWMKWMSRPSISVMNCGKAFSLASNRPKSYSVSQYCARAWIVASRTPCDSSATVSCSGQRVAARRRRRSASSDSGMSTWKGRISVALATVVLLMTTSVGVRGTTSISRLETNPNGLPGRVAIRCGHRFDELCLATHR